MIREAVRMKRIRRIGLLALTISLLLSSTLTLTESFPNTGSVLQSFLEPDFHAKPMARLWFPDAAAGEDDDDFIENHILEFADNCFGGV